jgi:hypothetical protein
MSDHWATQNYIEVKGEDSMNVLIGLLLANNYEVLVRYNKNTEEELGYKIFTVYYHYADMTWDGCRFALVNDFGEEQIGDQHKED